ncbi:unnamed protein product [Durusdinium trenchii]|uniref:Uncharacterized protein n=1 Tax=Durusdinium trenchii TaxID=1381693 RepID=A0ABP0LQD2_9DINO
MLLLIGKRVLWSSSTGQTLALTVCTQRWDGFCQLASSEAEWRPENAWMSPKSFSVIQEPMVDPTSPTTTKKDRSRSPKRDKAGGKRKVVVKECWQPTWRLRSDAESLFGSVQHLYHDRAHHGVARIKFVSHEAAQKCVDEWRAEFM